MSDPAAANLRAKISEWLRRYVPLEAASIVAAVTGGALMSAVTDDAVTIAYAAAWSENLGYYGIAAIREMRAQAHADQQASFATRSKRAATSLLWEFGVAEVVDSLVVRPLAMWAAMTFLGQMHAGIIAGKLVADVVFYGIAILFYEKGKSRR